RTLEEFGRLDGLVNNAGVLEPIARLAEADPAAFRWAFDVNLYGLLYTAQAALPALRATGGRIVNVSTSAAVRAYAGWGAYCTSKAAAFMLTRIMALEEPRVVVVAFNPGATDTGMQALVRREGQAAMSAERYEYLTRLKREGRLPPPERPGRALAWVVLRAPTVLSGEMVRGDDERVQAGVKSIFG
ncbi:MAG TPA: short-chain dehydrogenase, partial [Chloroflexi bacterium]|nr:short-chain dehydrogenase [Chloroflexota bacterium]